MSRGVITPFTLSEIQKYLDDNEFNKNKIWTLTENNEDKIYYKRSTVELFCSVHNTTFKRRPHKIKEGILCPLCYKKRNMPSIDELKKQFEQKGYELLSDSYSKAVDPLYYICKKHPDIIQRTSYDVFSHGHGCKFCARESSGLKKRVPLEELKKKFEEYGYILESVEYIDKKLFIYYRCKKHIDKLQKIQYCNFLNGSGCAYCRRSKGEREIERILKKYKINFEEQKDFPGCVNINPLLFDFYLPDYNLCIEYQGRQHFQLANFYGKQLDKKIMEENFEKQKKRDKIKYDYCKNNNINLLYITYKDFKRIEEILMEHLKI